MKHTIYILALLVLSAFFMPCRCAEAEQESYYLYVYRYEWTPVELCKPSDTDFVACFFPVSGVYYITQYSLIKNGIISFVRHNEYSVLLCNDKPICADCRAITFADCIALIVKCIEKYPSIPFIVISSSLRTEAYITEHNEMIKQRTFVWMQYGTPTIDDRSWFKVFPDISIEYLLDVKPGYAKNIYIISITTPDDVAQFFGYARYHGAPAIIKLYMALRNYEVYIADMVRNGLTDITIEYHIDDAININMSCFQGLTIHSLALFHYRFGKKAPSASLVAYPETTPPLNVLRLSGCWRASDIIEMSRNAAALSLEYVKSIEYDNVKNNDLHEFDMLRIADKERYDNYECAFLVSIMKRCKTLQLLNSTSLIKKGDRFPNIVKVGIEVWGSCDVNICDTFENARIVEVFQYELKEDNQRGGKNTHKFTVSFRCKLIIFRTVTSVIIIDGMCDAYVKRVNSVGYIAFSFLRNCNAETENSAELR